MLIDDKIITENWTDYNALVDSIMHKMDYESNLTKIELIYSAMNITKATYYDVELSFGYMELSKGNNEEIIDLNMYCMCRGKGVIQICLYSSYLDINENDTTSKELLYQDMRELITKILNDPIDQTLYNKGFIMQELQ
jgi:hypothetical protein